MATGTSKPMYKKGMWGSQFSGDTDSHTGKFDCIQMITATVFKSLTGSRMSVVGDTGDSIGDFTFPAQYELWGDISEYELVSGTVQAHWSQGKP